MEARLKSLGYALSEAERLLEHEDYDALRRWRIGVISSHAEFLTKIQVEISDSATGRGILMTGRAIRLIVSAALINDSNRATGRTFGAGGQ
jgi:hypothetical protein